MSESNQTSTLSSKQSGFLRLSEILKLLPIGKSTWWAGVKSGRFPAAVKIGPRTTAWRISDIENLIAEIASQGDSS